METETPKTIEQQIAESFTSVPSDRTTRWGNDYRYKNFDTWTAEDADKDLQSIPQIQRTIAIIKANIDIASRSENEYIRAIAYSLDETKVDTHHLDKQIEQIWKGEIPAAHSVNVHLDLIKALTSIRTIVVANPIVALTSTNNYVRALAKSLIRITPDLRKALKEKLPKDRSKKQPRFRKK